MVTDTIVNVKPVRVDLQEFQQFDSVPLKFTITASDIDATPIDLSNKTLSMVIYDTRETGTSEETITINNGSFTVDFSTPTSTVIVPAENISQCTEIVRINSQYILRNTTDSQNLVFGSFPVRRSYDWS